MSYHYFAYGSNASESQMRARCPQSQLICTAFLKDYELCFPRFGKKRKCGVASVEKCENSFVWGVIYKITEEDISELDKHEGFPDSYEKINVDVISVPAQSVLSAYTYVGIPQTGIYKPSKEYIQLIIDSLRVRQEIPVEYIEWIGDRPTHD